MIPPSLRSVSVEFRNDTIVWQCIFDKDATEDDFELLSSAATEVIADFEGHMLEELLRKIPFPEKLVHLKNLIYHRHEEGFSKRKNPGFRYD
jgi:hypothetical protein